MAASPPAVILSGGPIAVSVARSLGRAGIQVYALGEAPWDTVEHSRYCSSFVDLGSGEGVQDRWLSWLETGPRGAIVLPCHDDGLELVARNRASLVELGYVPIEANDAVLLAMLDKEHTYALARRAGIPAPRTVVLGNHDDLDRAADEIGFPSAVKPLKSHLFAHSFGPRQKAFIVHDRSQLAQTFERLSSLALEVMLTEIVEGADDQLFSFVSYMDEHGEPLVSSMRRKLRQYPPHFGMGSYSIVEWHSEAARLGLDFFKSIGLRGLASVEFKHDARDGAFKLMDCNHRLGTGVEVYRAAGIDLPLILYRLAGRPTPPVSSYRDGVRLWHPIDDVCSFLVSRREGTLTFAEWARSLLHPLHLPVFHWKDPKPSLVESRLMARRALTKLAAAACRGG